MLLYYTLGVLCMSLLWMHLNRKLDDLHPYKYAAADWIAFFLGSILWPILLPILVLYYTKTKLKWLVREL